MLKGKIFIGNKAQFSVARKMIFWMMAGVIITGVVFSFAIIVATYKNKLTQVPPSLEAELTALRFTNNPNCFAYLGPTGKIHSGTIELTKFNVEQMDKCYLTDRSEGFKKLNFKLKLAGLEKEVVTNNYFDFQNNDLTIFKEVLVWDGEKFNKDRLIIYVQNWRKVS
jgi:hypothetical protein